MANVLQTAPLDHQVAKPIQFQVQPQPGGDPRPQSGQLWPRGVVSCD